MVEATSGRSYGVIDTTARYVVPAMYKQMDDVREGLRAVQALDGTWAYLDSAGQTVIPRKFTDADKGNERLPDRVGAPGIS